MIELKLESEQRSWGACVYSASDYKAVRTLKSKSTIK